MFGRPRPSSLDLVFTEVKAKQRQQEERATALDSKAYSILAAAGIVTVTPALRLAERQLSPTAIALITVAGLCFLVLAARLWSAISTKEYHYPPPISDLYPKCIEHSPEQVKKALAKAISEAYPLNEKLLVSKARAVNAALLMLLTEAFALALGLTIG